MSAARDAEADVLLGDIAEDWRPVLLPMRSRLGELLAELDREEAEDAEVLPERRLILRALRLPLAEVRVLIIGQDPYPTPGHPIGLSFAVDAGVRPLPRSLRNIYAELEDDLGVPAAEHGDLSAWQDQGVLLLNRSLTVRAGEAGSHAGLGWEQITEAIIRALAARGGPLVAILWGRQAQQLAPLLDGVEQISSAHPSPLSARRGFFGSRPFSRADAALAAQGGGPIVWALPPLHDRL